MTDKPAPDLIPALAERLIAGDRAALARAITLVESKRADHRAQARDLLQSILPRTGKAMRWRRDNELHAASSAAGTTQELEI